MKIADSFRLNNFWQKLIAKRDFLDAISAESKKTLTKISTTAEEIIKASSATMGTLCTKVSGAIHKIPSSKIAKSIGIGFLSCTLTYIAGAILAETSGIPASLTNRQILMGGSVLIGTALAVRNFVKKPSNNPSPALAESNLSRIGKSAFKSMVNRWKGMSKMKKGGILTASLTVSLIGLVTFFGGPTATAKTIGDQFKEIVYTTSTKNTTVYEWIKSQSDIEEATRLASLSQKNEFGAFKKVSCAEILQTCHLDKKDPGHKKAYKEKMLKFHPDKFADKDLANKASMALNQIRSVSRSEGECPGRYEFGCLKGRKEVKIRKTLVTPHWLYGKLMRIEPTCTIHREEGDPIQTSLDDCS